jgi:hypothetical protein
MTIGKYTLGRSLAAAVFPDRLSAMTDWDPITLYQCDVCEWAATTGDPWDQCPHCDTKVPPRRHEVVYLSDAKHAVRMVHYDDHYGEKTYVMGEGEIGRGSGYDGRYDPLG